MKTKLDKTTSNGKELWLEVSDISEITTGNTIEHIGTSSFNRDGITMAVCKWKIVDENNVVIIPPTSDSLRYINGTLPSSSYNQWNKTEENFIQLMAESLNSALISNLIV
jgi:hypothetical protein